MKNAEDILIETVRDTGSDMEANPYNDEFQCEACKRVCDIEDSVKIDGEYICTFCAESILKQRNEKISKQ